MKNFRISNAPMFQGCSFYRLTKIALILFLISNSIAGTKLFNMWYTSQYVASKGAALQARPNILGRSCKLQYKPYSTISKNLVISPPLKLKPVTFPKTYEKLINAKSKKIRIYKIKV